MERPVMRQGEDGKLEERLREYTLNEVERRECCQREIGKDKAVGIPIPEEYKEIVANAERRAQKTVDSFIACIEKKKEVEIGREKIFMGENGLQFLREVEKDIEFVRKEFEKGMSNSLEEGARSVEQGTRPVLYTRYCGLHDKEHSGKCPECR